MALVVAGMLLRFASAAGVEDSYLERGAPQAIGVYCADPAVVVHLTADVFWNIKKSPEPVPFELVYLTVTGPKPASASPKLDTDTMIMISSSVGAVLLEPGRPGGPLRPRLDPAFTLMRVRPGSPQVPRDQPPQYVRLLTVAEVQAASQESRYGMEIGNFELPGIIEQTRGSFFAHLPILGAGEDFFDELPSFMFAGPKGANLVAYPQLAHTPGVVQGAGPESLNPADYQSTYGAPKMLYWQPETLATTEILESVQPELQTSIDNSIVPSDGQVQNDGYVWQASGSLESTMSLTSQHAVTTKDQWNFDSGIAFGVAAGTGVAFFQEDDNPVLALLGRWSRRLLRRRPRKTVG